MKELIKELLEQMPKPIRIFFYSMIGFSVLILIFQIFF